LYIIQIIGQKWAVMIPGTGQAKKHDIEIIEEQKQEKKGKYKLYRQI
jgi:hypothetical protein